MNFKKILIISRSFYPQNSPRSLRTTELAKELARQGHAVTILTPKKPEHSTFDQEHNLIIQDLGQPKWKEVELTGKGIGLLFKRGSRRGLNLFFEYPNLEFYFKVKRALRKKKKSKEHYDLLISIAVPYPIHWGVAAVWKKKNNIAKTWVADCGDPYMGQENDTFNKPFYFKFVEKWFCRKADYLSVPTQGAIDGYYKEFHHKIKIISQGFRFENNELDSENIDNQVPTFAYAGSFIPGRRDPKEFCEYLLSLDKDFKFYVYTKAFEFIKPFSEKSKGRIVLKDYIPRKDLLCQLNTCDFMVNFENAGAKQTPSKLIDYVILKKPILSIKTGDLNKKNTDEFLNGNYENQYYIDNPQQYRIENVVEKFLKLASDYEQ